MARTPKNHGEPWSGAEEKQLQREVRENTPTPLIAHKHGRTEYAIRGKAQELYISLKPTNKSPYGTGGKRRSK